MTKINDGGAAFPFGTRRYDGGDHYLGTQYDHGMSLRDWFAGQALISVGQTMVAPSGATLEAVCAELARASYLVADAMLAERSKSGASS